MIKALDTSAQEIEDALQHSSALEVTVLRVGFVVRLPLSRIGTPDKTKVQERERSTKAKGKVADIRNHVPHLSMIAPDHAVTSLRAIANRGNTCSVQHSIPYAEAIRNEWLHPDDSTMKEALRTAASELLGAREVSAAALFPRVFSQKLRCKPAQTETETDLADLGFQWGPDPGTVEDPLRKNLGDGQEGRELSPRKRRLHLPCPLRGHLLLLRAFDTSLSLTWRASTK